MAYVGAVLTYPDYKHLIDTMRKVNPELVKALRKQYRVIGRDVVKGIKTSIPTQAPLSGMVTKVGRLSWSMTMNQTRPIKSVVVRDRKRAPQGKYPIVGLIQVVTRSAPVALADMAGRSGAHINARAVTREYDYTYTNASGGKYVGKRKHRINGQGAAMIRGLSARASRYVYPGAEKELPAAKAKIQVAVNEAVDNINAMLRRA